MPPLSKERWRLASPALDAALDLPPEERAPFLATLRARDAALADDVADLLAKHDALARERFLEGEAPRHAGASLAGQTVGAYTLRELVGQGGMGSVWRAERGDGRFVGQVAVKLLHLSLIGRDGAPRFEREGAILARLAHPNIARLLDAGVTPSGQPYLVLELVEGEDLDRYCDGRRLSVEQRLALFDDVLAAVAHAHNHLVIHRDLKPSNILVTPDGTVKLLDFGIAKLLQQGDAEEATLTAEGQRALTPGYAAPEQLRGGTVSTATDVFALGVILYQLLAGRHPTAGVSATPVERARATLEADTPRLLAALAPRRAGEHEAALRAALERGVPLPKLRRRLRGDLENITARALRKDPAERYQTVAALADDLRRHRDDEPVLARPDSLAYRCAKFVRRHRGGVAAAAAVLLAVTAGLTGTLVEARQAQAQAAKAQRERDNALRQLAYAGSAFEFVNVLLGESTEKPSTPQELLARGEAIIERQFRTDPALRANLQLVLGNLYAQAEQPAKALDLMERARSAARSTNDLSLQADIECQLATRKGVAGSFDEARATMDVAITRLRAEPEPDRDLLATCLFARSQVDNLAGDARASLADAEAALATLGAPRAHQRMTALLVRTSVADAQAALGRPAVAVGEYRRALAELDELGRGDTALAATLHTHLGSMLSRCGQTADALEAYGRAGRLATGRGEAGSDPTSEGNYARLLVEVGRYREAMPLFEHARAEAAASGNGLLAAIIALQGAPAWCATSELARCAELLEAARAGFEGALPPRHSRHGTLKIARAQLALARADVPRARAELREAAALFEAASDQNPMGIRARTMLARTEQALGELDAAEADAARALSEARAAQAGFAHTEWLGSALVARGLVERARGRPAEAQASWHEALAELQATLGDDAPATAEVRRLLAGP